VDIRRVRGKEVPKVKKLHDDIVAFFGILIVFEIQKQYINIKLKW